MIVHNVIPSYFHNHLHRKRDSLPVRFTRRDRVAPVWSRWCAPQRRLTVPTGRGATGRPLSTRRPKETGRSTRRNDRRLVGTKEEGYDNQNARSGTRFRHDDSRRRGRTDGDGQRRCHVLHRVLDDDDVTADVRWRRRRRRRRWRGNASAGDEIVRRIGWVGVVRRVGHVRVVGDRRPDRGADRCVGGESPVHRSRRRGTDGRGRRCSSGRWRPAAAEPQPAARPGVGATSTGPTAPSSPPMRAGDVDQTS